MDKICNKHGMTSHALRNDGRYRCRKCAVEQVTKRRKKVKAMSVEYKGGKCSICNYNKCIDALDFHHLNPNTKMFSPSDNGHTRSWEKQKIELDKCILLCANCHREIHSQKSE